jgi:hypothetical protein
MARAATPSRWCVYQFHHFGIKDFYRRERGERREKSKVFSAGSATSAVNTEGCLPSTTDFTYLIRLKQQKRLA